MLNTNTSQAMLQVLEHNKQMLIAHASHELRR